MSGFVEWCEGCEALPRGFSEALREAEITTRMEARSLCEYTAAYLERVGDVPDWSLAGELLPILSLPRDTNLSDEDAAARLRANMLWATSAATGEARGVKPKSEEAKDALERIESAFEQLGDARLEQLTGVDLGVLETSELAKGKKPARKKQVTTLNEKALPKEEKKPPKKRTRKTPKAKGLDAQAAVLEKSLSVAPEEASAPRPIASSEKLVAATFGRAVPPSPASPLKPKAPSPKATTPAPAPSGGDAPAAGGAWTEAMQEREFGGVGRLPQGLYELIHASLASPEGEALRWRVSRGPLKPLLEVLPRGLEPPVKQPLELTGSAGVALEAWQRRRGELARALLAGASKQANFVKMINAPLLMLQDDGVRAMAQALVQASADLYNLAAADHGVDASTRARVLALDTMHIEADDGQHLIVLSPLHPLKLGQALARYDALTQAHDTSPNIRSVMTRSLLQAPVCPSSWPLEGGNELSLSQTDQNIIVYESNPADASDADIEIACELLLLQYLDLHPHARVGVNAIIRGGSPGPALEGFASALAKAEGAKLNAFISVNNDGITRRRASAVIEEKRLTLRATPADEARLKPHLVIQLNPSAVGEEALMTSSPPRAQYTGGVAALMPSFMLVGEGLVTRTSVAGVLGVDETEALLASLRGHARRGFLELAEAAARLS
ncbi:MAG: hypothetical protein VX475_01335, partial [Myxococcota bacterium]|nr:hypothetical protein [Myxococcota bacterium]